MNWIFVNFIEGLMFAWFVTSFLQTKQKKWILYTILFVYNFSMITLSNYISMYDLFLKSFLIMTNTLICHYFTKNTIYECFFYLNLESLLLVLSASIATLINSVFPWLDTVIVSKVSYFILGFMFIKLTRNNDIYFSDKMYLLFSFILFGLQYVSQLFLLTHIFFENDNTTFSYTVLVLLACIIGTVVLFFKMADLFQSKQSYERLKTERANEVVLSSVYENMMIVKHDLKHDYLLLDSYCKNKEYDKIESYLSDKIGHLEKSPSLIHCQNDLINTITNNKLIYAYTKNIQVECEISVDNTMNVKEYDLHELLSNLLDNAIENTKHSNKIQLKIIQDRISLFIKVINPINEYSNLQTKKDKKYHGYGLKSIDNIVKKYDGHITIEQKNFNFIVEVMLLLKK